jgi:ATP-dependent DNA helicase PIF1
MENNIEIDISSLSNEQKVAYTKFIQKQNLFITGAGGTGKTKLIKTFVEYAKSVSLNLSVCAMTGCAAILLNCGARTIHSWSGIKLAKGERDKIISSVLTNRVSVSTWKKAKVLIIDEVSMLSKKVFEILEEIARAARLSSLPFGGIQVIFVGDFYQLPPIGDIDDPDAELFCFESPIWKTVFKQENHIELVKIFRQSDIEYVDILTQIRKGELKTENVEILQKYLHRKFDIELNNGCVPTKIFPTRIKVDYVNNMMFSKIKDKEYVCSVSVKTDCLTFIESNKPILTEVLKKCNLLSSKFKEYEIDMLTANAPCVKTLRLKKGAAVMCTINLDMDNGICNGSQGIIIDIIESPNNIIPIVKFSNGIVKRISQHHWQSDDYPSIAIFQYPLMLAWAMTIHKIQGATLDMAEIDIGSSIFEYGQSYVALSRVKSLNGVYLSEFQPDKIVANPKVSEFYESIKTNK